jgi:elongation factor P
MISTGEFKKGVTVELDGTLYQILDYEHIKVGRGSAQVRIKLRDVKGGHTIEKTVQAGTKFNRARVERREMQFLYEADGLYYFMNTETYDQIPVSKDAVGDAISYLKENANAEVMLYDDQPIGVELPVAVELQITQTDPGFKGDTATGGSKPAKLETGLTVNVPLFLNEGDVIKVDTRSGQYLERV